MMEIVVLGAMFLAGAMCAARAVIGPTAPDRVVAIDALVAISISAMVFLGFYYNAQIYLDVALVYAMLSFVGSIAVAKYLEREDVGA